MHWALHRVLGEHVEQRGSKVKPDEFTFDFSHTGPVTNAEKAEVERLVNEKIYADLPVASRELGQAEAKKLPGVKAFFGDKYGDVRPRWGRDRRRLPAASSRERAARTWNTPARLASSRSCRRRRSARAFGG